MTTATAGRKTTSKGKDTRLFARISTRDKSLIEKAAVIAGQSVATFVVTQARAAAMRMVNEDSVIRLGQEESRRLVEALLSPPTAPTAAMRKAMREYRKSVTSDVNPDSPTYRQSVALW